MATLISDFIDRIQRRADRVDSGHRVRARDALDESIQWYAKTVPWPSLMRLERFETSGSEFLVFPDRVLKIVSVGDLTNTQQLEPGDQFGRRFNGTYFNRTSGRLCEWKDMGLVPVTSQPNTDTTLQFQSTVSENYNAYVKGLVRDTTASGTALELYEVLEAVGITSSDVNTTSNSFVRIIELTKDRPSNGDLTINYSQDGRRASRIPLWEARPLFPQIQLFHVPNPQATLEVEYYRRPDRITSENGGIDASMDEEALVWRAAGNMHWVDQEGASAKEAWEKATEIVEAKKNVEESFGEKDFHIEPAFPSYFDQENLFWTDG